jgi:hypothetical protein
MVDLSAGRYQTVISPVDVGAFLDGLCTGAASFLCDDTTASLREEYCIAFDEKIALLAMENGVTNSLAHGDGLSIKLKAEYCPQSTNDGRSGKIILSVENGLPPEKKGLTAKDLSKARDLALEEIASKKLDFAPVQVKSSGGNRSGLRHTGRACIGAGGSFDLFLQQENAKEPKVVMRITLPAKLTDKSVLNISKFSSKAVTFDSSSSLESLVLTDETSLIPEGLKICAIDDSMVNNFFVF